jgi:hypothetical protein
MKSILFTLIATSALMISFAQSNSRKISNTFTSLELNLARPLEKQIIRADKYLAFEVNFDLLNSELRGNDIPHREDAQAKQIISLELPNPEGGWDTYRVLQNTTMHPELMAKFPEIRTYDVIGINNRHLNGKIDITPHGFHAMIYDGERGIFFIDPIQQGDNKLHMSYWKHDFTTEKSFSCHHDDHEKTASSLIDILEDDVDPYLSYASCQLRRYRLALAATGEYTVFHGGTVTLAAAAQTTTMNRVNGVFERELAIPCK